MFYTGTSIPTVGQARGKIIVLNFAGEKITDFLQWGDTTTGSTGKGASYEIKEGNTQADRYSASWRHMQNCKRQSRSRSKFWFSPFSGNGLLLRGVDTEKNIETVVTDGITQL